MRSKLSWRGRADELRSLVTGAALVVLVVLAVTAVAYAFAARMGVPFEDLSRDPTAVFDGPTYVGYYANLTILWWQVPATAAVLASVVLRRAGRREVSAMLLVAGLITAVMAADDFFLVHELVSARTGLPQSAAAVVYLVAIVGWALRYRHRLGLNLVLVAVVLAFWSMSAALDSMLDIEVSFVVEDGAKLLGVALWSLVLVRIVVVELCDAARAYRIVPRGTARHRAPPETSEDVEPAVAELTAAPVAELEAAPAPPDVDATTPVAHIPPRARVTEPRVPDPRAIEPPTTGIVVDPPTTGMPAAARRRPVGRAQTGPHVTGPRPENGGFPVRPREPQPVPVRRTPPPQRVPPSMPPQQRRARER